MKEYVYEGKDQEVVLKKVLEDAKKVNTQKQVLLAQSKNGYIIDYNTPTMKLALRKMK